MKFPNFSSLILFENNDFIVVNKPPFLASLDERGAVGEINLLRLSKQYCADAQICHRLDKETSGALIIAKNPEAYRTASMQFERRKVEKTYHAVVEGHVIFDNLRVDLPILNDGNRRVRIDRAEGKRAETVFNSLKYYKHFTLVACKPITGRMHQIRIHLASQRAVIVGDDLYKGSPLFLSKIKKSYKLSKDEEEQPIIKRFALHAYHVVFKGTVGDTIDVIAPYPKDMETLVKLLDKFDS